MKSFAFFLLLFGATCTAGFAAAQQDNSQGFDIEPLDIDAIRASTEDYKAEAEALATNIRARSEAVRDDARQTQEQAKADQKRYVKTVARKHTNKKDETFDFDAMIAAEADMTRANLGKAPRFIAFVSLSMPPESLKTLSHDVAAAGGVTVLRGFPGGNAKNLTKFLRRFVKEDDRAPALGIDPRLFRAFDVNAAPTFIMASTDFDLCDGFECVTALPPHDRMTGNVSAHYVLERFASGSGPGSHLAALHLRKLAESKAP